MGTAKQVTFGVTAKLFLAILAVAIIVTLAMGAALRWNFERDFFSYIQAREERRAERIEASLTALYRRDGSWAQVKSAPGHWRHLLSVPASWPLRQDPDVATDTANAAAADRAPFSRAPARSDSAFAPADPRAPSSFSGNDLPPNGALGRIATESLMSGMPRIPLPLVAEGERGMPPSPPYTLLDRDLSWLAGAVNPPGNAPRRAVRVGGETVGWLITPMPERIPDDTDLTFQSQQQDATWIISLLAVVLAALASIGLARIVLAPVRRLARGTHALVAGDYAARVRVSSGDELGELARDFNVLAGTLQRNEGLRREWFADISHELRTPLAIMRGELEALQDNIRPVTPHALQSLQAEVARVNNLIDDLYELALSDVGALTYRMSPVRLDMIVGDEVQAFATRLQDKGIEIDANLQSTPALMGDAQRLSQLIVNLLENSVRYTNAPGRIEVAVTHQGQEVVVEIQDTPPGVPTEALPRLFDRLFRVDPSRSRESGGAGLGLAICERIVHSHSGTIEALPSPLGGLRVRIVFPVSSVLSTTDTRRST